MSDKKTVWDFIPDFDLNTPRSAYYSTGINENCGDGDED